ncbi:helix-turn-helix transcriptional regulator [Sphingobium sp.]|uniref:helix-turn-helix transcriptional regulator n=1 Tax=Sphingobium sp. TaxID=1912891 RepID=UPI0035C6AD40
MDQIAATHRNGGQIEPLLRLVTDRLDAPMGMVTLHGGESRPPHILAALNMPDSLRAAITSSIDDDLGAQRNDNGIEWPRAALCDGTGLARLSFSCRTAPSHAIVLTACRAGQDPNGWDENLRTQLSDWVDPFLALLCQAEREAAQRELLARAIDRCDFGLVLLDSDSVPWFTNARAQRLLDAGDGIRRAGHAISASDFDDAVRLQTAIRHDNGSGDRFRVLLLHRARARPLIAVVTSLGSPPDLFSEPTLALYMIDPDRESRAMVDALCRAHGLTATEAALAAHLAEGATVEDAASRMHIQTQTARAYLKQVFAKTGTHRQAELVRSILSGLVHIG